MKQYIKISTVITTFNDSETIVEFLEGIRTQKLIPDEIIIVDGGSKDNTVALINEYFQNKNFPIKIVSDGVRRNISEGFNTGIRLAKNNWILILGTGNSYKNNLTKEFIKAQETSNAEVFYSSIIGINDTTFSKIFNQYFLKGNKIQDLNASNHAVLIHKNIFERYGYYWEKFIYAGEDSEYFMRLKRKQVEMCYVPKAIAFWDTPKTWKEYKKKMEVNSIADWQIESVQKIIFRIISQTIFFSLFLLLLINQYLSILLIPIFYMLLSIKQKTWNPLAISLGLFTRFIMIYFYLKNFKYSKKKFHIETL